MGKTNRPYIMRAYGYWDPTADAARIADHPALAPLLLPRLPDASDTTAAAPSATAATPGATGAPSTSSAPSAPPAPAAPSAPSAAWPLPGAPWHAWVRASADSPLPLPQP